MEIFWISLSAIFCTLLGYRIAVENRLSGVTGLSVGVGCCVIVGSGLWQLGTSLILAAGMLLTLAASFLVVTLVLFLAEKYKIWACAKLVVTILPFSIASIGIPRYGLPDRATVRSHTSAVVEKWLPTVSLTTAAEGKSQAGSYYNRALISPGSYLYTRPPGQGSWTQSSIWIKDGTWVLTKEEFKDPSGRKWFSVLLPDRAGGFNQKTGLKGSVPARSVSSLVPR